MFFIYNRWRCWEVGRLLFCYYYCVAVRDIGRGWCWRAWRRWQQWWILLAMALAVFFLGEALTPHGKRGSIMIVACWRCWRRNRPSIFSRCCRCRIFDNVSVLLLSYLDCRILVVIVVGAPAVSPPCHWELRSYGSCHSAVMAIVLAQRWW